MSDDRFERNLAIFAERFPDIHAQIVAKDDSLSTLRYDDEGPVDIDLGSGLLHKGGGRDKEIAQARSFLENPYIINYNVPLQSGSDSLISRRVFFSILHSIKKHESDELALLPVSRTGYLIVLGVGLGYHLPILAEELDLPYIIIVEPVVEFLRHSLHAVDWDKLIRDCDERGTTIRFVCRPTPERMNSAIIELIEEYGTAYVDGSYLYTHYPLWSLQEARRRLITQIPLYTMVRGYFEDERKMVQNTVTNLHKCSFRVLQADLRPRVDAPAFLIGAGPSLDEAADFIREWQDRAIIFSSGSSLQACLRHGIIPDFHTELENDPSQYDKMKHMAESRPDLFPDGRFKGITLIASTTLNPRVAPFFEDVIFFFRDSVSSTSSFGRDFSAVYGIAPTVANTSLATATYLGFGEVYMFGYDCGWRDTGSHHAKDTIYYTTDTFKETFAKEAESMMTVPGNFGGEVRTEPVFDWSRSMLEGVIAKWGITAFNCSDGALIEGAVAKVPEAVMLSNPPLDRQAFLAGLVSDLRKFEAGTFFAEMDFTPFHEDLDTYGQNILATFDRILDEGMAYHPAHDLIRKTIAEHEPKKLISAMVSFSTRAELKLAAILTNRIADPDRRSKVTADFFRDFRAIHEEMLAEAHTILDEAEAMVKGGPEPWWTAGLAITKDCSY